MVSVLWSIPTAFGNQVERRIRWENPRVADDRRAGLTDSPIFQAYKLDGPMLWQINLREKIREGSPHTRFMDYDLDGDGRAEMVCKAADGSGPFNADPGAGGRMFRAIDKKTGAMIHEFALPASTTGVPMTDMANDRPYIVVATGARGTPAKLVALAIP